MLFVIEFVHVPFQAIDDRGSLEKDIGKKTLSFIDQNNRGMGGVQLWLMAALLQEDY